MSWWGADGTPGLNGCVELVSRGMDPPSGYVRRTRHNH
jgi:hypothetical protein